jgi:cytochrome c peroxidase
MHPTLPSPARLLPAGFLTAVVLGACSGDGAMPEVDKALGLPAMTRPDGWSEARAELGKKLFFDTRLSSNGEMSCSTCHLPDKGWTDGKQFSQKVSGAMNTRNSPTLFNVGYQQNAFYWDGRAPSMEKNVAAAWKGHMGGDPEAMAATLNGIPAYKAEFEAAFGGEATGDSIVDAFCAFVRSLQAGGTRYDQFKAGDQSALTADEQAGMTLFQGKAGCIACHTPPLFTDMLYHNVGIGMDAAEPDVGANKPHPEAAIGSFKTPTLRAVAQSAPYFHDGSVATLEEAVGIMCKGGLANEHLDPILKAFAARTISAAEQKQIVAFLTALTPQQTFTAPKLP